MDKSRRLVAILICAILTACVAPPRQPAAPTSQPHVPVVTLALAPQLRSAQDAMQARNFTAGIAQGQTLESLPNLTPYDVHVINELLGYGFSQTGELSRAADLIVVAPASAHILARMAAGLADDLATTLLLATDKRVPSSSIHSSGQTPAPRSDAS